MLGSERSAEESETGQKGVAGMLKCPACGRAGGPFRLRHQVQADSRILRNWACPCGQVFTAIAGTERPTASPGIYSGFQVEYEGKSHHVALRQIQSQETVWDLDGWSIVVNGPPDGPGTRIVKLVYGADQPLGEWRLQPGWGPNEVGRRIRVWPLPPELAPDLLARVLVRVLS